VFAWVGRRTTPKAVSKVADSARTASGKRALSSRWRSRQSMRVANSRRAEFAHRRSVWSMALSRKRRRSRTAARCGPPSTTSHVLEPADLLAVVAVVGVDVPGVPGARQVDVGPQLVAATGEHLAARALVEHARQAAVVADLDAQQVVLEVALGDREARWGGSGPQGDDGQPRDRARAAEERAVGDALGAGEGVGGLRRGGARAAGGAGARG
jgi:hypothetical protein